MSALDRWGCRNPTKMAVLAGPVTMLAINAGVKLVGSAIRGTPTSWSLLHDLMFPFTLGVAAGGFSVVRSCKIAGPKKGV